MGFGGLGGGGVEKRKIFWTQKNDLIFLLPLIRNFPLFFFFFLLIISIEVVIVLHIKKGYGCGLLLLSISRLKLKQRRWMRWAFLKKTWHVWDASALVINTCKT